MTELNTRTAVKLDMLQPVHSILQPLLLWLETLNLGICDVAAGGL